MHDEPAGRPAGLESGGSGEQEGRKRACVSSARPVSPIALLL